MSSSVFFAWLLAVGETISIGQLGQQNLAPDTLKESKGNGALNTVKVTRITKYKRMKKLKEVSISVKYPNLLILGSRSQVKDAIFCLDILRINEAKEEEGNTLHIKLKEGFSFRFPRRDLIFTFDDQDDLANMETQIKECRDHANKNIRVAGGELCTDRIKCEEDLFCDKPQLWKFKLSTKGTCKERRDKGEECSNGDQCKSDMCEKTWNPFINKCSGRFKVDESEIKIWTTDGNGATNINHEPGSKLDIKEKRMGKGATSYAQEADLETGRSGEVIPTVVKIPIFDNGRSIDDEMLTREEKILEKLSGVPGIVKVKATAQVQVRFKPDANKRPLSLKALVLKKYDKDLSHYVDKRLKWSKSSTTFQELTDDQKIKEYAFVLTYLHFSIETLGLIHAKNIIYCDWKYENVLVDLHDENNFGMAVTDFGNAMELWESKSKPGFRGTIRFAPPRWVLHISAPNALTAPDAKERFEKEMNEEAMNFKDDLDMVLTDASMLLGGTTPYQALQKELTKKKKEVKEKQKVFEKEVAGLDETEEFEKLTKMKKEEEEEKQKVFEQYEEGLKDTDEAKVSELLCNPNKIYPKFPILCEKLLKIAEYKSWNGKTPLDVEFLQKMKEVVKKELKMILDEDGNDQDDLGPNQRKIFDEWVDIFQRTRSTRT